MNKKIEIRVGIYWLFSLCVAIVQGGFWWFVLNIFFPIAPIYELAKLFVKYINLL